MTKLVDGLSRPWDPHQESRHQLSNYSEASETERGDFENQGLFKALSMCSTPQSWIWPPLLGRETSKNCFHEMGILWAGLKRFE